MSFLLHIPFLIGHIRPVCSLFKKESVLKNPIQIATDWLSFLRSKFSFTKVSFKVEQESNVEIA